MTELDDVWDSTEFEVFREGEREETAMKFSPVIDLSTSCKDDHANVQVAKVVADVLAIREHVVKGFGRHGAKGRVEVVV